MEAKEKTNLKLIIILLLVIVVLLAIFLGINRLRVKNYSRPSNNTNNTVETVDEYENVTLNDPMVLEAQKFVSSYFCGGLYFKLEKKDKDVSQFTDFEKFNIVLSLFEEEILKTMPDGSKYTFKEERLKRYFKDLKFMEYFKPAIDTASDASGNPGHKGAKLIEDLILPVYLSYKDGIYTVEGYGTGCTGPANSGDYLRVKGAKKNDEHLIVDYLHYYSEADFDDDKEEFFYRFYKEKGASAPVDAVFVSEFEKYKFDESKYDSYQMIFDISEDQLQFVKLTYNQK